MTATKKRKQVHEQDYIRKPDPNSQNSLQIKVREQRDDIAALVIEVWRERAATERAQSDCVALIDEVVRLKELTERLIDQIQRDQTTAHTARQSEVVA